MIKKNMILVLKTAKIVGFCCIYLNNILVFGLKNDIVSYFCRTLGCIILQKSNYKVKKPKAWGMGLV